MEDLRPDNPLEDGDPVSPSEVPEGPVDEVFYSEIMQPNGDPVFQTKSKVERDMLDKVHRVLVTDTTLDGKGGGAFVALGGHAHQFPLDEECELYGFQIRQLRSCKFDDVKTEHDPNGNLKVVGTVQRSRFRVEVLDDGL